MADPKPGRPLGHRMLFSVASGAGRFVHGGFRMVGCGTHLVVCAGTGEVTGRRVESAQNRPNCAHASAAMPALE